MKTGIELIAEERQEQIEKHGRSIEQDAETNSSYQLATAACRMTFTPEDGGFEIMKEDLFRPEGWGKEQWIYLLSKPYKERLIIAGALIAAELDRLNQSKIEG